MVPPSRQSDPPTGGGTLFYHACENRPGTSDAGAVLFSDVDGRSVSGEFAAAIGCRSAVPQESPRFRTTDWPGSIGIPRRASWLSPEGVEGLVIRCSTVQVKRPSANRDSVVRPGSLAIPHPPLRETRLGAECVSLT